MSIAASRYAVAVLDGPELSTGARLVLLLLADYASRDGAAWPSESTLARRAGLSERQVRRLIGEIASYGIVDLDHRPGRSTVYRFPTAQVVHTPDTHGRGTGTATPDTRDRTPDTHDRRPQTPMTAEPTKNRPLRTAPAACCDLCDGTGWQYLEEQRAVILCPCSAVEASA